MYIQAKPDNVLRDLKFVRERLIAWIESCQQPGEHNINEFKEVAILNAMIAEMSTIVE
jgi:hypothetical protein